MNRCAYIRIHNTRLIDKFKIATQYLKKRNNYTVFYFRILPYSMITFEALMQNQIKSEGQ